MDKKHLKEAYEAGENSGFNLEYRALSNFQAFYPNQSRIFINYTTEMESSLDLCAQIYNENTGTWMHFLVECKGTCPDNILLLVESQLHENGGSYVNSEITRLKIDNGKTQKNEDTAEIICHHDSGPILSFNGNFFKKEKKNGDKFTRTTPSDDQNNLFKAVKQLQEACKNYPKSSHDTRSLGEVIPMVITNAEIYVQSFQCKKICNAPWVVYSTNTGVEDIVMPHISIVNINHLHSWLNHIPMKYPDKLKPQWSSIDT